MLLPVADLATRHAAAEERLARAETLSYTVEDLLTGRSAKVVLVRPNLYLVDCSDGTARASDGKRAYRRLPDFGWYEDFAAPATWPEELRHVPFWSFHQGEAAAGPILDSDDRTFRVKMTESALFYGVVQWNIKRMVPVQYDFWEMSEHQTSEAYSDVKVGAAVDWSVFRPIR
jgi:hypothetical protein